MAKLGDVCNFYSGTGFPNAYQGDKHGKYPFYKVGDISKNVISGNVELISCDNYINDDVVNLIKGIIIPPQCVVFAKIGEALKLNRRALTSCYCLVDNNVMGVQANNLYLDSRYFYYFMCNVDLQRYSESTAVPSVRKSRIAEIEIPLPSLEEQRHIAAILDKVTDLIAQRRAQLDKLDLLVKSRFVEMFGDPVLNPLGWRTESLKDVCIKLTDGTHFSPDSFEAGDYKYITAKNIKVSGFDFTNITYVSEEVHRPIYERCNPELGDVLYIKDGVTTGIAMVNTLDEEFSLLSSVALLKQDRQKINGYFLAALLNNENMYTNIRRNMGGAAITRLTIAKLNIIPIILPPIELQNQFSFFVEKIEKSKLTIHKSLDKLEILKQAIMQRYFK